MLREESKWNQINCSVKNKEQKFPGGLAVKDPAFSLLWFRFDPWPGSSTCCGCSQKENQTQSIEEKWKTKKQKTKNKKQKTGDKRTGLKIDTNTIDIKPVTLNVPGLNIPIKRLSVRMDNKHKTQQILVSICPCQYLSLLVFVLIFQY